MAMSPRLLRPRASGSTHPEAAAWATRVTTNGGTVGSSTLAAVSKFCRDIDAAGIRDKFYRLNLFCGDNLSAALVPLYRAESSTASVRGNTTDTNNNFVSGDFNNTGSSSGLVGNGTSKYLDTGILANSLTASNAHLGVGVRTVETGAASRTAIGTYDNSTKSFELGLRSNQPLNAFFTRFATATDRMGEATSAAGLAAGDILAAWPTFYRNGAATGTAATTSSDYTSSHSFFVFALRNHTVGAANYASARMNWYSIGLTMTAAQALSFYNAIATFNSTLSRT